MKKKKNARDLRAEAAGERAERWGREAGPKMPAAKPASRTVKPAPPAKPTAPKLPLRSPAPKPATRRLSPEEEAEREAAEALEFLDYLERETRVVKDEDPVRRKPPAPDAFGTLNLERGMPVVVEAVGRLSVGLQEMRLRSVRFVRVIHGYGSTGRGGALRVGVRAELARLKRTGGIRDYAAGEDFGPFHEGSRRLADRYPALARDRDWGRGNQGITIVVL